MEKPYNKWNEVKKKQNVKRSIIEFFNEMDIWWMYFGVNLGDEEDGKGDEFTRPVLIVKKFNQSLFWGCAVSTKIKPNNKYYVTVYVEGEPRSVIISQLRLYDIKRLKNKINRCTDIEFREIKKAIISLL